MMPDEKRLLDEVVNLTRENHQILKSIQRQRRWQRFFWVIKWLVILALTAGLYYYLQPFIDQLLAAYQSLMSSLTELKQTGKNLPQLPDFGDINKILEGLKGAGGP